MGTPAQTVAQTILNHLLHGDLQAASALVSEHAAVEQNNPEFLYMAARVAREARDLDAAKQIFARLVAHAHDDSNVHELGYKLMYDCHDLPAALKHVAAGAQLEPPNVYMKQLALLQVTNSDTRDQWIAKLCRELLLTPQEPEAYQRTASILNSAGLYDMAIPFLDRGLLQLPKHPESHVRPVSFTNDKHAAQQLKAGNPVSFPAIEDTEWYAAAARMVPCPHPATDGPAATVIVTSHISNKLVQNAHKAPPNTEMLQETLASFRQHAQLPKDWPIVICFDAPKEPRPADEAAYLKALEPICAEYNATVRTYRGAGLRQVFLDVYKDITTPYFMMLEHDWVCAHPVEPLPAVVQYMNDNPHIHHMRYPRHHTHINASDWYLMRGPHDAAIPHTFTPYYSNNPSLTRVAKFTRDWLPAVKKHAHYDSANSGAGGVEETITMVSMWDVHRWGIYANMAMQGCAIIGHLNDEPRVIHTGI